jgi:hypothetical protein
MDATLTVTIRQNATRTPGDSARFTSVELSENARTRPTTASTPKVFALNGRADVGDAGVVTPRRDPTRNRGFACRSGAEGKASRSSY